MTHNIKLRIEYADAVLDGSKCFEVRKDDRGYQKGDIVMFEVIDGNGNHIEHPLEKKKYRITYVLHGWGLEQNWCAFSIKALCESEGEAAKIKIEPTDFGSSPVLDAAETMLLRQKGGQLAYDMMPLKLGQMVSVLWYDGDKQRWERMERMVTGVCFDGFRLSSAPKAEPLDSADLFSWDKLGKDVFRTMNSAKSEAIKRNAEMWRERDGS